MVVSERVENIVVKGSECWLSGFSPFPTMFSKDFSVLLKLVIGIKYRGSSQPSPLEIQTWMIHINQRNYLFLDPAYSNVQKLNKHLPHNLEF